MIKVDQVSPPERLLFYHGPLSVLKSFFLVLFESCLESFNDKVYVGLHNLELVLSEKLFDYAVEVYNLVSFGTGINVLEA